VRLAPAARGDPLIGALPARFEAFGWHSYEAPLPPAGVALAHSSVCLQAFRVGARAWGIQFHAEVTAADLGRWLDRYESDPDAVRIGLDVDAVRAEAERRIEGWNRLGRELALRFLAGAERSSGAYSGVR
jgi:GMP synthase (glutamine-hydrolysing)